MKVVTRMNAMKVFYYLMAVDGVISDDELEKFDEIGNDIDSEAFSEYKDSVLDECKAHINTAIGGEDFYDVIQEGLDEALHYSNNDISQGITVRLLVWNMLAIAFSNDEYSDAERRIILHVVRTTKMDRSVFLEMEQLIKTAESVNKEHAWVQTLDKPYAEIRPIVDELEKRQRVIVENAKALIEDEIEPDSSFVEEKKRGLLDDAMDKINPLAAEIGTKTKAVADDAKKKIVETVNPAAAEIKAGANRLFGKLKARTQKKSDSENEAAKISSDEVADIVEENSEGER